MGSACSDNRTVTQKEIDRFLLTLRDAPDYNRSYRGNTDNNKLFKMAWANGQFGSSIFTPLSAKYISEDGNSYRTTKRDRTNNLEQLIKWY